MKKYLSLFIVLLLSFINTSPLLAASDSTTSVGASATVEANVKTDDIKTLTPEQKAARDAAKKELKTNIQEKRTDIKDTRAEIKDVRQEAKDTIKEKRGEIKDTREEFRKQARTLVADNLLRRADNLTQISTRIKTRIEKLKTKSIDTANATSLVLQADASITIAKTNAIKAKADISSDATIDVIKADIQASKEAMKQAYEYLKKATEDLKAKVGDNKDSKKGTDVKIESTTKVEGTN